jgi:type II secretory pathway pseudopilin PulG
MRAFSTSPARRAGGFTIVELAAVLLLVTLVSTLAIRSWFARSEITLENAAEILVEDLRHMQAHANLQHTPLEFAFDEDGSGYRARDLHGNTCAEGARRYSADAVFEDVRVAGVRVEAGERLMFDALGHPACDASITLTQRGATRTVLVSARTNTIAVERDAPRNVVRAR